MRRIAARLKPTSGPQLVVVALIGLLSVPAGLVGCGGGSEGGTAAASAR
jgi:hypothetical protein